MAEAESEMSDFCCCILNELAMAMPHLSGSGEGTLQ